MGLNQVTLIDDLVMKHEPEDDNLLIVEDVEDTKKTTLREIKKSFVGDYRDPSDWHFYTSKFIKDYFDSMRRDMSQYASDEELLALQRRVEDIIASAGSGQNSEVVEARDSEKTLQSRLQRDLDFTNDMYLKKARRHIEGKKLSTGMDSYADIYLYGLPQSVANAKLNIHSKNLLNMSVNNDVDQVDFNSNGFKYTQINNTKMEVEFKIGETIPAGSYMFFASIVYDSGFADKNSIKFAVKNSKDDSAYIEFVYKQDPEFVFTAPKAFDTIKLLFNKSNFVTNAYVNYNNLMLTRKNYGTHYIPYYNKDITLKNNQRTRIFNKDYDITCSHDMATVVVEYYDQDILLETVLDNLKRVTDVVLDERDQCGLITDPGEYLFFDNETILSVDGFKNLNNDISSLVGSGSNKKLIRLAYNEDYKRNGISALKVTFNEDVEGTPSIILKMKDTVNEIDSLSFVFYVDATVSQYFYGNPQFTINLCSDSFDEPDMVNYYSAGINTDLLVQGWNIIKIPFTKFVSHGNPNEHGIQYIELLIDKNTNMDNKSIYLNSFVFNQKMKPTVLLAFDGIYEEGITYTYPYLSSRNFPATILSNSRQTFSRSILDKIVELRAKYGWDLGQYGCNPKKEQLVEDGNSRDQYLALKFTKEWLQDNLVFSPISYSAPFGNLRPITVPILKDLGYKIAKVSGDGFCNFFDPRYDFAIPMYLMSNEVTEDEVIDKIQYAIENNCCICIYTNNVTEYGDEISSKKVMFENVIKYITDHKNEITPMTFSEFYKKCGGKV